VRSYVERDVVVGVEGCSLHIRKAGERDEDGEWSGVRVWSGESFAAVWMNEGLAFVVTETGVDMLS
jgi:hypothetical protein